MRNSSGGSLPWIPGPGAPCNSSLVDPWAERCEFSMAMAHKINLLKGAERQNLEVATSKSPWQPSGMCQADRGELGREGSDPVAPTVGRDNAQFPAVSASDNPIIPSLFFQSLFEPVTHYKQNVFVLFLTAKLWNNKGLGEEFPTCVFPQGLQQLHFHQSRALFSNGGVFWSGASWMAKLI